MTFSSLARLQQKICKQTTLQELPKSYISFKISVVPLEVRREGSIRQLKALLLRGA